MMQSYTRGNPPSEVSQYLPGIREWIFENGTGSVLCLLCLAHMLISVDVSHLLGDSSNYGSFQVYANLSIGIDGITSVSNYNRSMDFNTGLHTTAFTANDGNTYTSTVNCSYPDQVCVYDLSSSAALPEIKKIFLENKLTNQSLLNATCGDQYVRLTGVTQLGPP